MKEEIGRRSLNVSGRYYVDCDICVHHECCIELAPDNFQMSNDYLTAYVFKQPDTPDEEARCREALKACPTAAIRDDGQA